MATQGVTADIDVSPGRAVEEARLDDAVRAAGAGPQVVVIHGEPGIGKTTLLHYATARACAGGFRPLVAAGVSSAGVSSAGVNAVGAGAAGSLRRVVAALLGSGAGLPEKMREPLERWLRAGPASARPGDAELRLALLSVVLHRCRTGPVVLVVDDLREADGEVVALLMFVVRRLRRERFLVLLAVRSLRPFGAVAGEVTLCPVPPLNDSAAAGLLDRRPNAPTGRIRAEILHYGGGNPLALTELARAAGAGDSETDVPPDFRVDVTGRLARTFAPGLADLPERTRRALLSVAAAEDDALDDVLAAAGATAEDLRPAEEAALISLVAGRITFRHPMTRAVAYFGVDPQERRQAHAALAARLPADSGLHHWHVANAGRTPVDARADAYERAAVAAVGGRRGLEIAMLLQRSAESSRDPATAARRYARAAAEADRCGDLPWSRDLWQHVLSLTDDPELRGVAVAGIGNTMMFRPAAPLLATVGRLFETGLSEPSLAAAVVSVAACTVLTDGAPADVDVLRRLAELARPVVPSRVPARTSTAGPSTAFRALTTAVADPAGWTALHGPVAGSSLLDPLPDEAERLRLLAVGGVAWVVDETAVAVDHYRRALTRLKADGSIGVTVTATVAIIEQLFELGLFEEAGSVLAEADELVGTGLSTPVRRAVAAQRVTLSVRQGDLDGARARLAALGEPGPDDGGFVRHVRHRATGQVAAASGDPEAAFEAFASTFGEDGEPVHYLLSQRVVVELAAAAIDAGLHERAVDLLRSARLRTRHVTARREWSWQVAFALLRLGAGQDGETRLRELLAEPGAGTEWPYEYAVVEARLADWLRRRRRLVEARPLYGSALDTFLRLAAPVDAGAVRNHLRATGVRAPAAGHAAFDELTAQHQQIARLAARGLSNRAIAERFGLSPRTIGFHLYQIYPRLGIARREQLRGVVPPAWGEERVEA